MKNIGSFAFENCINLTSVTVPDSVVSIGEGAFKGCSNLAEITLPFVGADKGGSGNYDDVFGYIFGYSSSYVNGGVYQDYYRGEFCYYYIPGSLKKVAITNESILSNGAFYNCSNLVEININEGVTYICKSAFYNCTNLTSITVPDSVTTIGSEAFYNCTSLTSIILPSTLKSIGAYAFYNCTGITSISIPEGVTSVGSYAFYNCDGLTSVTFPDSVESIGYKSFNDCSNLNTVILSKNVSSIDESFGGCSSYLTFVIVSDSYAEQFVKENKYKYLYYTNQICFDSQGGTNTPDDQTKTYGIDIEIPLEIPERKGYIFKGWSTGLDNVEYLPGDLYSKEGPATLYAVWAANEYAVTLNFCDAVSELETVTVIFGSKYSVLPIPVRNHYEFKGWYTSTSDDGILITNQDVVSMDFDHTLYAHWDLINVTDILIDKSNIFMYTCEKTPLIVTILPADAYDIGYTWSCSDESVVHISQDGTVTAVKEGTATITATSNDGGKTANCVVNVRYPVEKPYADRISGNIFRGTKIKLTVPTWGAEIFYTIDGSDPKTQGILYEGAITISNSCTLKAVAKKGNLSYSDIVTYDYIALWSSNQTLEISSASAVTGETVSVEINLKNNPGIYGLYVDLKFDDKALKLINVVNGEIFKDDEFHKFPFNNPYELYFESSGGNLNDSGKLATLVFEIKENTLPGNYPISITYSDGDIVNYGGNAITPKVITGVVNVLSFNKGDANNDGTISGKDITSILDYLVGKDSDMINAESGDFNNDKNVTLYDLNRFMNLIKSFSQANTPQ